MLGSEFVLGGFMWEDKHVLEGVNEENKALDESLKEKKIKIQKLKEQLELEKERNKLMQTHQSDLNQGLNYMQQVNIAQKHELELESNSKTLAKQEKNRVNQEIGTLVKDIEEIMLRQKYQKSWILKQKEKIENLKSKIKWEEEALFKWLEESAEAERGRIALIQFIQEDDAVMKALNIELQKLSKNMKDLKISYDEACTDVLVAETEVMRLYMEFKNQHKERSDIISNWEKVLQKIENKNIRMKEISKCIDHMRDEENQINKKLKEQKMLLESQVSNNKDLENQISDSEHLADKLRQGIVSEEKAETSLKAEVDTLKSISHCMAYQAQSLKNEVNKICNDIEHENEKIDSIEKNTSELKKTVNDITSKTFTAEHYVKYLECLLEKEQKNFNVCENKCNAVENMIAKNSKILKNKIEEEKVKEADLLNAQALTRQCATVIHKCDQRRLQQENIIYHVNLCIKNRESRIHVMEGKLGDEEEKEKLIQVKLNLQTEYKEKNDDLNFMMKQIKHMQEQLVISLRNVNITRKQRAEFVDKLNFLDNYNANIQRSLKCNRERKEELLVENCLFNLQLQQYKDMMSAKNTAVINLQKDQVAIETITKKRLCELQNCSRMLQIEINKESEENYQTRRQIQESTDKANKLQMRHDMILKALGIPECLEVHTEILIKIENDKIKLQREKTELVMLVLQKEEELQALQNTVWLIQNSVEHLRKISNPSGISEQDNQTILKLEDEYHKLSAEGHTIHQTILDLDGEISKRKSLIHQYEKMLTPLSDQFFNKDSNKDNLINEISELNTKILRAEKSNSRLALNALAKNNKSVVEDDVKIQLLRDIYKTTMDLFHSALDDNPTAHENLKTCFQEKNLLVPVQSRTSLFKMRTHSSKSSSALNKMSSKPRKQSIVPSVITLGSELPTNLLPSSSCMSRS